MRVLSLFFILVLISTSLVAAELRWVGSPGYEEDGVEPELAFGQGEFTFKVAYYDPSFVLPNEVWVVVDTNRDNFLGENEKFLMESVEKVGDYYVYEKKISLRYKSGSRNDLTYFFGARFPNKLITTPLRNGPIIKPRVKFSLSSTYWDLGRNVAPGAIITMSPNDRIIIENTGDGVQTFALEIEKEDIWPDGWKHSPNASGQGENVYVLSALFAPEKELYINEKDFNKKGNDDVVTTTMKKAGGPIFSADLSNPAEYLKPYERVALWFQLKLPTISFGRYALATHNIVVKLTCLPVE